MSFTSNSAKPKRISKRNNITNKRYHFKLWLAEHGKSFGITGKGNHFLRWLVEVAQDDETEPGVHQCFYSKDRMASDMGIAKSTVENAMKELVALGIIKREKKISKRSNGLKMHTVLVYPTSALQAAATVASETYVDDGNTVSEDELSSNYLAEPLVLSIADHKE